MLGHRLLSPAVALNCILVCHNTVSAHQATGSQCTGLHTQAVFTVYQHCFQADQHHLRQCLAMTSKSLSFQRHVLSRDMQPIAESMHTAVARFFCGQGCSAGICHCCASQWCPHSFSNVPPLPVKTTLHSGLHAFEKGPLLSP